MRRSSGHGVDVAAFLLGVVTGLTVAQYLLK